jgi:transportin-3
MCHVYLSLVKIIIKQLQYPTDQDNMTIQEIDEFRDFRYDIGDVLKDCVRVIGEEAALSIPYSLLRDAFQKNFQCSWQEIEALLFSLRTMCSEVSNDESKFIPGIMEVLQKLPTHPKITYAAILVIGRYSIWTNYHPELLSYQLDFVSKGFQEKENLTKVAAAHAFRDLAKNCKAVIIYLI